MRREVPAIRGHPRGIVVGEIVAFRGWRLRCAALGLFALAIPSFAVFGAIMTSAPALAACSSHAPGPNSTVTCTDNDTTPIASGNTNVTVNVLPNASLKVVDDNVAISLSDASRVNNAGTISAGDSTAGGAAGGIAFSSTGNAVVNNGAIIAGSAFAGQVFGIFRDRRERHEQQLHRHRQRQRPVCRECKRHRRYNWQRHQQWIATGDFATGIFACCGTPSPTALAP